MAHEEGPGGEVNVTLSIGAETSTQTVSLGAGNTTTVLFEDATSGLAPGTYEVTMAGSNASVSASLTLSVDVNGDGQPATDTTGNGLLNNVDGDDEFTIFDVQALFNDLESPAVKNNPELFDFNEDSPPEVNIFDVQRLFEQLP
jgi:uncharacterized protein YfaS (alpha-2-macroglobulin family)